jgi:type II secretory pathway pseudopilin PulG
MEEFMRRSSGQFKGFTIIELMVGIFVTIMALGTFFKLYTNSIRSEKSASSRISALTLGDHIIETLASHIRLIGLGNGYVEDGSGEWDPSTVISVFDGGDGIDDVQFRFISPFGGPIAKLVSEGEENGGAGKCTFQITQSAAIFANTDGSFPSDTVKLFAKQGIFTGTLTSLPTSDNKINIDNIKDVDGNALAAGNCATFPLSTLLTGNDFDYEITYTRDYNGGNDKDGLETSITLIDYTTDPSGRTVYSFQSDEDSSLQIPRFSLQFLREYDDGSSLRRQWVSTLANNTELSEIKAVRIGMVIVTNQDRIKPKDGAAIKTIQEVTSKQAYYCPFVEDSDECYELTNPNRNAYVFRRVIHLRNFDYLKRNSSIEY